MRKSLLSVRIWIGLYEYDYAWLTFLQDVPNLVTVVDNRVRGVVCLDNFVVGTVPIAKEWPLLSANWKLKIKRGKFRGLKKLVFRVTWIKADNELATSWTWVCEASAAFDVTVPGPGKGHSSYQAVQVQETNMSSISNSDVNLHWADKLVEDANLVSLIGVSCTHALPPN